jgi:hypothetical protein
MKALISGGVLRNKAGQTMGLAKQPERAEMIIQSLLVDKLIVESNGVLHLPL